MTHVVIRNAAKVSIGGAAGNKVASLLRRGDIVPEGVSEEQLADLVKRGFIEEVETGESESDEDSDSGSAPASGEEPYKGVTIPELNAEIEKRNADRAEADKIVPAAPGNRAEIVAALVADDAKQS
ncbi:hypothetical protein ACEYYH_10495 [Microbacterium trichothecenolyticum]|uniref:hypothetical protein n=1 Tax=Microbacterium trichothecenolyticum TaxID=69370 RepID=UPI0035BE9E4A